MRPRVVSRCGWIYILSLLLYLAAVAAIVAAGLPLARERLDVEGVPVEVMARRDRLGGPAVVAAHGYACSRQIMYAYGYTLAHRGYTVYLLDWPGHGANPQPLRAGVQATSPDPLQPVLDAVVRYAAARHPSVAILGHSMGGGAVTRYGVDHPEVAATINVSSGWGEVTTARPRNYLIMVGALEFPSFRTGAQGLLEQAGGSQPGVRYGDPARGSARELVLVPAADHILMLFNPIALQQAAAWLDGVFGVQAHDPYLDARLLWLALAYVAALLLARPLTTLVLRGAPPSPACKGPGLGRTLGVFVAAALVTPLAARVLPDGWLPLAVAGYVVNYWAVFGLISLLGAWLLGAWRGWLVRGRLSLRDALAALGLAAYLFLALGVLTQYTAAALIPIPARLPWLLAALPANLLYFGSGEALIRSQATRRAALVADLAHKGLSIISLTAAIFLLGAPFFLALLLPVLVLLFAALAQLNHWLAEAGGGLLAGTLLSALVTSALIVSFFPLVA